MKNQSIILVLIFILFSSISFAQTTDVDGDVVSIINKTVSKSEFLKNTQLVPSDTSVTILSYHLEWRIFEMQLFSLSNSAEITTDIKNQINTCSKDLLYTFSHIIAVKSDGSLVYIPDFNVKIVSQ